ncbi:MAG: hypothetical protein J6J13_00135 [Clostridia bacterium]|nr:hypothetical protein [Clostridia bacterium]
MRKLGEIFRWFVVLLLVAAAAIAIITAVYWLPRRDCLCYKARIEKDVLQWEIDETVLEYAEPEEGVMKLQTVECKHGDRMWLRIDKEWYSVDYID